MKVSKWFSCEVQGSRHCAFWLSFIYCLPYWWGETGTNLRWVLTYLVIWFNTGSRTLRVFTKDPTRPLEGNTCACSEVHGSATTSRVFNWRVITSKPLSCSSAWGCCWLSGTNVAWGFCMLEWDGSWIPQRLVLPNDVGMIIHSNYIYKVCPSKCE